MKPVVGAMQAWSCVVISVFAIIILSVIGSLYRTKHHEFVGSIGDPKNPGEVSTTIFTAVIVFFWWAALSRACSICERIDAAPSRYDFRPSIPFDIMYMYNRDYGVSQWAESSLKVASSPGRLRRTDQAHTGRPLEKVGMATKYPMYTP
ncbi:hypothetical protein CHU98_g4885 [Xylaria longipes]|nr:hypothetical protein CHU98_g4885 [Xylaria longipes]